MKIQLFKPYLDKIKSILNKPSKPEVIRTTTLDQVEEEEVLVKAAFDEDIISLEEYVSELNRIKVLKEKLKSKKQDFADAIIKNEKGEILLLKRTSSDTFYPGVWCLPGGKIEDNEDPRDAVIREVKEETSLSIASATLILEKKIKNGSIFYFLCEVKESPMESSIVLDSSEHDGVCSVDSVQRNKLSLILDLNDTLNDIEGDIASGDYDLFPTYTGEDGKRYFGYSNAEVEIANDKNTFMVNLLSKGEIDEDDYVDYICKSQKSKDPESIKLDGKNKAGKEQSRWVTKSDLKVLAKHAKNSSQKALEIAVKEHSDPTIREHAHKELDRRRKEEVPQDKEKKGYEGHEYHGKDFKFNSEENSYLDENGDKANPSKLHEYYNQRHKEQSTTLDELKSDLETSAKQKRALTNKLVKAYYSKIKKTKFTGDNESAYNVALLKLEKVGLSKDDIDHDKLKVMIAKKLQ